MSRARTITRRSALLLAGSGVLATALKVGPASAAAPALPVLTELFWRLGQDGVHSATLRAAPIDALAPIAAQLQPTPSGYAGSGPASSPGPLLRLVEGERYRLRFLNNLTEPTNLHLHGLRIPPAVDAPFRTVHPGHSATYEFTLPRGSAATYWYHPHLHGLVESQMLEGLVGGILVDPRNDLPADSERLRRPVDGPHTPRALEAAEEVVLLVQPLADPSQILVNGMAQPRLRVNSTRLHLRLVNASVGSTLVLRWVEPGGHGVPFWQVASDAGLLPAVDPVRAVTLPPGGRAELLADVGHGRRLVAESVDGDIAPVTLLTVSGPDAQSPPPKGRLVPVPSLRPAPDATVRSIVLGLGIQGLTIDGRQFDPDRDDIVAPLGALEIWEVSNTTDTDHPFHLHSYPVQVLDARGYGIPAWRDVITIPAHGRVRLAVPLGPYAGRTVFHCHIAGHEDSGMMAVLHVR